ncbi:hypothetical protein [Isoptericola sp. 178]|uniref:hypothetical protein n=1 Tax=Isoptericola sp. 178 TaxID=3064651 RepID=UPI002712FD88|nr:hypothetical protein [Isoptericola sp. 178]MDO8145571.1 hypothetical protein [Isoptericola sp. 178]
MRSDDGDERSPYTYRAVAEGTSLALVLRLLCRPSEGQLEMAFGANPRSDQRVGMLRKAHFAAGGGLVGGTIIGVLVAFYRGRRFPAPAWTEVDSQIASIAVGATLTYVALLLPLFVTIGFRRRVAERDHETWLVRSRHRRGGRFVPDPRSQPQPVDLGAAVTICLITAAPIWALVL